MKRQTPLTLVQQRARGRAQRRRHERDLAHRLKTRHHNRYLSDPVWQARANASRLRDLQNELIAQTAALPMLAAEGAPAAVAGVTP